MNAWLGRILMIAVAVLGASVALPDVPTAEVSRFIPIALVQSSPAPTAALATRAGSLDQLADIPEGLLIEGWVSSGVDGVSLVVGSASKPQRQEVLLLARPDVAASGEGLFVGFRAIFPGVMKSSVRCVMFEGLVGSTEMLTGGHTCT